jgi:GNAT superfamily N-acetyltransferase
LDDVLKRSDAEWQQLTRQYAGRPNSHTYFAFENDIACGMSACVINGENVELFSVWVDPQYRRKGVGRALVQYGRKWSLSKGAIRIKVGIYQDNQNAVVFYRSMGFVDSSQVDPVLSSQNRSVFLFHMQLR